MSYVLFTSFFQAPIFTICVSIDMRLLGGLWLHCVIILYIADLHERYLRVSLLRHERKVYAKLYLADIATILRNRAMHALTRDFVRAYAVTLYDNRAQIYIARIIRHSIFSNPPNAHVEYFTSVGILQSLITRYNRCNRNTTAECSTQFSFVIATWCNSAG